MKKEIECYVNKFDFKGYMEKQSDCFMVHRMPSKNSQEAAIYSECDFEQRIELTADHVIDAVKDQFPVCGVESMAEIIRKLGFKYE